MPNETADNDENPLDVEVTPKHTIEGETAEPRPNEITEPKHRRVHVTRRLVNPLLNTAEDTESSPVGLTLAPISAGELDNNLDLDSETSALTHFYMAEVGQSVSAIFGMGLGTPAGHGRARFPTYPQGPSELTERDGLMTVMFLTVLPWERRTPAAFDRAGWKLELAVLDAGPPQEELD